MALHSTPRKLDTEDFMRFPDDGKRHELIDGVHYVSASPRYDHQAISRWLQAPLFEQIERAGLGVVIDAPMDVHLGAHDIVEPDLIVVLRGNPRVRIKSWLYGPPDLVVEILSPTTSTTDRGVKTARYAHFGVPEYWIVAPAAQTIEQYVLEGREYVLAASCRDWISPRILPTVRVDLGPVWNAGLQS